MFQQFDFDRQADGSECRTSISHIQKHSPPISSTANFMADRGTMRGSLSFYNSHELSSFIQSESRSAFPKMINDVTAGD